MNTSKFNPSHMAVINTLLSFIGAVASIFVISLIKDVSFLTIAEDPVMMTILFVCTILAGVSTLIRDRK